MSSDAYVAVVHMLPHGRWFAGVSHRHGQNFVDLIATENEAAG